MPLKFKIKYNYPFEQILSIIMWMKLSESILTVNGITLDHPSVKVWSVSTLSKIIK